MKRFLTLRLVPPLVVLFWVAVVEISRRTGIGPGLLLFVFSYVLFPAMNLTSIALAGPGRRWSALAATVFCYVAGLAYGNFAPHEMGFEEGGGEFVLTVLYYTTLSAALAASAIPKRKRD
ncbi:MAG: hypothetical protein ACXVCS_08595 [Bdellovibrionota bacterium]